jgi:hypothetical protein
MWTNMRICLRLKYPLFLSDFNEPEFSRLVFEKYSNIKFTENPPCEDRFVPCRRTGTETDGHDGANGRCFRNFANTPKKWRLRTVGKYKPRQCGSYNCKKSFCIVCSNQLHSDRKSGYLNEDVTRYCTVCPLNTAREWLPTLPATLPFRLIAVRCYGLRYMKCKHNQLFQTYCSLKHWKGCWKNQE